MKDTNAIGARTEAKVLSCLTDLAFVVLIPFGVTRYDFVVDTIYGFKRVQCKTGRLSNGVITFKTHSYGRDKKQKGYKEDADYFGVYCFENNETYLVPVSHVTETMGALRVTKPKNGQVKNIRWADDYRVVGERNLHYEGQIVDLMNYGYTNQELFQD